MSDNSLIEKLLDLPEFEVTDFKQNEHDAGFYVRTRLRPSVCPACGVVNPKLTIHKTRKQTVRDINAQGKRTALIISRKYYHCEECNSHFAEPLMSVKPGERITIRLRMRLSLLSVAFPFTDIQNEFQISDTTIRKLFLEIVRDLPKPSEMETPSVLGIDEICLVKDDYQRKTPWAVIANGDEKTVMDILRNRSKSTVVEFLKSLKAPEKVEVVTMDMWSGYRSAVQETLPKARVVIDKFHVVRMANDQMDYTRRHFGKLAPVGLKRSKGVFLMREDKLSLKAIATRDAWFEVYPQMKTSYDLKEAFFRMYDCKSRYEAERYFRNWQRSIPKDTDYNGWRMLAKTVRRFWPEIFNYFDYPYTNAFVEGLNSVIRAIANEGRGYDFEILRGKVLLRAGRKHEFIDTNFDVMKYFTRDQIRDYGVPFDSILEAIKKGKFK